MFDEQAAFCYGGAPALSGYNQANEFIPRGKKRENKPRNKTIHIRGTPWKPDEWGYVSPEDFQRNRAKDKRKKKITPEKLAKIRAKIRAKRKALSEEVNKHHERTDQILMETHAFHHENAFAVLQYVKGKLETMKTIHHEKLIALRAAHPKGEKGSGRMITEELGKLKTPEINLDKLKANMDLLDQYFDRQPEFKDYYGIKKLPTMTYLSTARSFFSMVRHEIMKAIAHKVRETGIMSDDASKFLKHYHEAQDILGKKLRRGWHAGMVGEYRADAAEHNKFQRRIMTAKYNEWMALNPNAEKIPRHVRNFDPNKPRPDKSPGDQQRS